MDYVNAPFCTRSLLWFPFPGLLGKSDMSTRFLRSAFANND